MKTTKTPAADRIEEARALVRKWLAIDSPEAVAGRIGCSVRSVANWSAKGRISNLSAKAILAAADRS